MREGLYKGERGERKKEEGSESEGEN